MEWIFADAGGDWTIRRIALFFRRIIPLLLPVLLGCSLLASWPTICQSFVGSQHSTVSEANNPTAIQKHSIFRRSSRLLAIEEMKRSVDHFSEKFRNLPGNKQLWADGFISTRTSNPERKPIISMARLDPSPLQSFAPLSPVSIFSDSEFASSGFPGSGTSADPYRIEGYNITNSIGSLIQIHDTSVHFCIKGNWLNGLGQAVNGVELQNVTHGTVDNNTIFHNAKDGIWLHSSTNTTITDNRIYDNNEMGIAVRQSTHATISGNSISSSNLIGIFVRDSEHNLVASNSVDNHTLSNIYLASAANNTVRFNTCSDNFNGIVLNCADNNTLVSNNLYNHSGSGIYGEDSSNNFISQNICAYNEYGIMIVTSGARAINSSRNVVFWNYIYDNNNIGITLDGCPMSSLASNRIHDNEGSGIFLSTVTFATVANNTIYNNAGDAIGLHSCNATTVFGGNVFNNDGTGCILNTSTNTTVTWNTFSDNSNGGIWVGNSHFNIFSNNAVGGNAANGMWIENSKANNITDNGFDEHSSGSGIHLYFSQSHVLSGNRISSNSWYGIALENSDANTMSANSIDWNGEYAIFLGNLQTGGSLSSDNNTVKFNALFGNNQGYCQAFDSGFGNVFSGNYWNDWTSPDMDSNNVVDSPYVIDSSGASQSDLYPLVAPSAHVLIPFTLSYPNGGEMLSDNVTIQWTASEDSLGHAVTYAVYYSLDKGESWSLIASNLTDTSFVWKPSSSEAHGSNCLIKVAANCGEALTAEDISDATFVIEYGRDSSANPDIPLLAILALLILIFFIPGAGFGYLALNAKLKKEPGFTDFIQSSRLEFLQAIYHKVIIGLENIRLAPIAQPVGVPSPEVTDQAVKERLPPPGVPLDVPRLDTIDQRAVVDQAPPTEPVSVPRPDIADPTVLTTYFPPDIRHDLKSGMKGRTVLTLIELAYQYPSEINPTKLSKLLNVPPTTISDEIKRLLKLQYIESATTAKTLHDARYKYYSITAKGATFLQILKGTLAIAIEHLRETEHDIVA